MEMEADSNIKPIILRFLEGVASEEDVEVLHQWLEKCEENRQYFEELNNTYQTSVTINRFSHGRLEHAWGKLLQQTTETSHRQAAKNHIHFVLKIAAAITLLVATGSILYHFFGLNNLSQHGTIVRNSSGKNTRILLPDSSTVWLNANSTLEYNSKFDYTTREVTLKGEAFFDVKKDNKAFIVKTDKMQVYVKGTRFNVEAYKKNTTIKTTLEEGKVELHVDGTNEFFTMQPGDQAIFNMQLNNVVVRQVNPADFSAWKEDKLVFDNTPLKEIVARLENRFKVNITIRNAKAGSDRVSMTIEQETIEEVLELIKLSSQLRVKMEGNEIILYE